VALTREQLDRLVSYSPEQGTFRWKPRNDDDFRRPGLSSTWNDRYVGRLAGHYDTHNGQLRIMIMGRAHNALRLAFILMTGVPPTTRGVYRDGDVRNNRWSNLTTCAQLQMERALDIPPPVRQVPPRSSTIVNQYLGGF